MVPCAPISLVSAGTTLTRTSGTKQPADIHGFSQHWSVALVSERIFIAADRQFPAGGRGGDCHSQVYDETANA